MAQFTAFPINYEVVGKIKIANNFAGADIGAKINQADAALVSAGGGTIWAFPIGTNPAIPTPITTPIVISSGNTLKLHNGSYKCATADLARNEGVAIQLKDNSHLEGESWNTIIIEPNAPADPNAFKQYRCVHAFNMTLELPSRPSGTLFNTAQSNNISVKNIQFKGVRANPHDGGNAATIALGNTHQGRIENCWFNQTSAYGGQFGGNSVGGFHAEDGWYLNNLHTNLMSQNVAVTNCERVVIEGNIFKDPGKPPYTITAATNASPIEITLSEAHHMLTGGQAFIRGVGGNTAANGLWTITRVAGSATKVTLNGSVGNAAYTSGGDLTAFTSQGAAIDVEPNGDPHLTLGERIYGVAIKNNVFDFRNIHTAMSAIAYQMVQDIRNEGCVIEGNVMLGNETGAGQSVSGILLSDRDTRGVLIANNYINKFTQIGMRLRGVRVKAVGNQIIHCGGGGLGAIEAQDLEYSTVENNTVLFSFNTNRTGTGAATVVEQGVPFIFEKGLNRFNTWSGNICSRIQHMTGTGTAYDAALTWRTTDCTYKNNTAVGISGGIDESVNSNRNLFDGNMTDPKTGATVGLTIVGAASKVLIHKYTDGRVFVPSIITTAFTNPA